MHMPIPTIKAVFAAALLASCFHVFAQPDTTGNDEFQALEAEARAIKSEVLDLEAEISALEQEVRYPAHSRWTVFVTSTADAEPQLQQIELAVDGSIIASHQYTEIEQKSLADGGAHRLYLGNLSAGQHQIGVKYSTGEGTQPNATSAFVLDKATGPRLLELRWQPDVSGGKPLAYSSHADTP